MFLSLLPDGDREYRTRKLLGERNRTFELQDKGWFK